MKKCSLCFNNFIDENGLGHNPKVLELCCKYLHSAFALDNLSNQPLFCSKCLGLAMQLGCFCEQMDFLQKSISELILTFSLEILHRRGKRSDYGTQTDETSGKRLIQFDVSAFPDCNTWNISIDNSDVPGSTARNSGSVTPENVYVGNVETEDLFDFSNIVGNGVEAITVEEIKNETSWIDESIYFGQEENYATGFPTEIENTRLSSSQGNPIIKLKKLKFNGNGRKSVVVKSSSGEYKCRSNEGVRQLTTIWSKKNPSGSYRMKKQNSALEGPSDEPAKQFTAATDVNASASTHPHPSLYGQTDRIVFSINGRVENKSLISKAIKQNAATIRKSSVQCNLCRKVFASTQSLLRHQLIHSGDLPFKCDICSKMFRHKHNMITHRRLHTGERPYQCSHCSRSFSRSDNLKFHLLNYHQS